MIVDFYLDYPDSNEDSVKIFSDNLQKLEMLCKKALKNDFLIALHSDIKVQSPSSVYELSVLIAEDMVKKFNPDNIIIR